MIKYKKILVDEIDRALFKDFIRNQQVNQCWRKENNKWVIKNVSFIDDWNENDYKVLIACLKRTVNTGGFVFGAFSDGALKGFVSVESTFFGDEQKYLDLSSIHVSKDMRNSGIGRALFLAAKEWGKAKGAKKLYISAHSAVESQFFYKKMGCVEAEWFSDKHVDEEPYDCQLECKL